MTVPALRNRVCPLCGSHDAAAAVVCREPAEDHGLDTLRPYWFGIEKARRFFTYRRCDYCGLLYNRVFFDDAQLNELYGEMPPNMDLVPNASIAATQRGYFDAAVACGALDGDYLEIGPDIGHIVSEAVRRGRFNRYWLFEPNRAVHDALRSASCGRPTEISPVMDDLSPVPDASVGLAVMIHVLDHLLDPLAMLQAIRGKLRPGGRLLIVTHDEQSLLARILGPRWPAFCLQHPELYNPRTIKRMLVRAGYDGVKVSRSVNHFPIDFLARQAGLALGLKLDRMRLPRRSIGLRLGNMLTLASVPDQAAADAARVSESLA